MVEPDWGNSAMRTELEVARSRKSLVGWAAWRRASICWRSWSSSAQASRRNAARASGVGNCIAAWNKLSSRLPVSFILCLALSFYLTMRNGGRKRITLEVLSEPRMVGRQRGELAELTRLKERFQHLPPVFW